MSRPKRLDFARPLAELLKLNGACVEASEWARRYNTASAAWLACKKPEWMLWALEQIGYKDESKLRLFACWCARNTPLPDGKTNWDLLTDQRSRTAVEVAERHARGEATDEELAAAWAAARDAARAAARAAAWDAARDAQAKALRKIVGNPFKTKPAKKESA